MSSSFSCNDGMNASSSIIGCASSEPSPAAELIAVNTDLLAEILVCLPATSLIRFKSVSKHWLSLISDSRFAIRHTARNPRPSALGLFLSPKAVPAKPTYVPLQGHPNPPSLDFLDGIFGPLRSFPKINHSSNGLLLCEYPCRIHPDVFTSRYLVCNPTTRSYNLLPSRILPRMLRGFLAFDPSKSPHYKVVVMSLHPSVQIYIYFSESSSWKEFHPPDTRVSHVVLCSGVIYWICEGNGMSFMGFDIDSEKMLELPPLAMSSIGYLYFGEFAGRLTLIQSISPSAVLFRILEMDKDHWHWIVKFEVNLAPLFSVFRVFESRLDHDSLLHIVEGQKEKDFGLVISIQGKVMCYSNLKSKMWDELCHPCSHPCATYPFVPSLFPL